MPTFSPPECLTMLLFVCFVQSQKQVGSSARAVSFFFNKARAVSIFSDFILVHLSVPFFFGTANVP